MEDNIYGMLQSQQRIQDLMNIVGSRKPMKQLDGDSKVESWIAPPDKGFKKIELADLLNENTTVDSMQSLVDLVKKSPNSDEQLILTKSRRFRTAKVPLTPVAYPKQVVQCPTIESVTKSLSEEELIISVYSYSGYSFSSEYTHVYKGSFNKGSALSDLLVLLRRALRCTNPSISDKNCTKYADYIARIAPWEAQLSGAVVSECGRSLFPHWAATPAPVPRQRDFHYVEVYIGHNAAGELSFSVRIRNDLELVAAPKPKEAAGDKGKGTKPGKATPTTDAAVVPLGENVAVESVYYREFVLNDAAVDAFGQVSFLSGAAKAASAAAAASSGKGGIAPPPPPPPPRRNKRGGGEEEDDLRVFWLISHQVDLPTARAAGEAEAAGEAVTVAEASADSSSSSIAGAKAGEHDVASDNDDDEMKRPSAPGSSNSSSSSSSSAGSFCAELYGWGFDASHSLGLGDTAGTSNGGSGGTSSSSNSSSATRGASSSTAAAGAEQGSSSSSGLRDLVHGPRRIPMDRLVALERVQSVACSSQHSLLLTAMGSVFACGENSEGALGTGDFLSR
jgi:hypothetical protein